MGLMDRFKKNKTKNNNTQSNGNINYAKLFKDAYERNFLLNTSGDISQQQINEILGIMGAWGQKFPDDLNYQIAFIVMQSGTWSADRLQIQIDSVKKQYTPVDKQMAPWFDRLVQSILEIKRTN